MSNEIEAASLRVYLTGDDECDGKPAFEVVRDAMHAAGLRGATVYEAIMGYGGSGRLYSLRALATSAGLPVTIEAIDEAEKIRACVPAIEALVTSGLIVLRNLSMMRSGGATGND